MIDEENKNAFISRAKKWGKSGSVAIFIGACLAWSTQSCENINRLITGIKNTWSEEPKIKDNDLSKPNIKKNDLSEVTKIPELNKSKIDISHSKTGDIIIGDKVAGDKVGGDKIENHLHKHYHEAPKNVEKKVRTPSKKDIARIEASIPTDFTIIIDSSTDEECLNYAIAIGNILKSRGNKVILNTFGMAVGLPYDVRFHTQINNDQKIVKLTFSSLNKS